MEVFCRCDVCVKGPPNMQNLKEEADILMQVIAAHRVSIFDIYVCVCVIVCCVLIVVLSNLLISLFYVI